MIDGCISSFQSYQVIKAEQSAELIKSIRNDIIPAIQQLLKSQTNDENKMAINLKSEGKKINELLDRIKKVFFIHLLS
jgi:hypothetical protein